MTAREATNTAHDPIELLPLVFRFLNKSQSLSSGSLRFTSRRLSAESAAQLERTRSIQDMASPSERGLALRKKVVLSKQQTAKITPLSTAPPQPQRSLDSGSSLTEALVVTDAAIFRETTCLLHESEAVVVIEYIEAVVPLLYAVYISILFHLPNAKYYKDMEAMTQDKMHHLVTNIFVYALFEVLSLVHVFHLLKRSFGVSVFYQLASRSRVTGASTSATSSRGSS